MNRATAKFESPFALSLRPGEADDLKNLALHHYFWTGWKRRHWPADILRPGVRLYGFDGRHRTLRVLLQVTRGGAFVYRTKREFAAKVQLLTEWRPDPADPHWRNIAGDSGERFNTGIALRWRVVKRVRIPLHGRFPQLGWLKLDPRRVREYVDPAEEFLEGGRKIRQHMRTERSPTLRAHARDLWRARLGGLKCIACGFSFERRYGQLGVDFIEMHHQAPLAALPDRSAVRPEQLKPLCANCHRMVHSQRPMLTIRALKLALSNRQTRRMPNRRIQPTARRARRG
jgi:hypothetical protein